MSYLVTRADLDLSLDVGHDVLNSRGKQKKAARSPLQPSDHAWSSPPITNTRHQPVTINVQSTNTITFTARRVFNEYA